jgi:hypothetical protein
MPAWLAVSATTSIEAALISVRMTSGLVARPCDRSARSRVRSASACVVPVTMTPCCRSRVRRERRAHRLGSGERQVDAASRQRLFVTGARAEDGFDETGARLDRRHRGADLLQLGRVAERALAHGHQHDVGDANAVRAEVVAQRRERLMRAHHQDAAVDGDRRDRRAAAVEENGRRRQPVGDAARFDDVRNVRRSRQAAAAAPRTDGRHP